MPPPVEALWIYVAVGDRRASRRMHIALARQLTLVTTPFFRTSRPAVRMAAPTEEVDDLVVGAGASGISFVDTLFAHSPQLTHSLTQAYGVRMKVWRYAGERAAARLLRVTTEHFSGARSTHVCVRRTGNSWCCTTPSSCAPAPSRAAHTLSATVDEMVLTS